jgi:4-hydroxythreonine-4-phosphate dehydrogenase
MRKNSGQFLIFGNIDMLKTRADVLGMNIDIVPYKIGSESDNTESNSLLVKDFELPETVIPGELNKENSVYVIEMIKEATLGCLSGQYKGLITAPVHKHIINESGIKFSGHTEYIATLCNSKNPIMTFISDTMRIALATTHVPLKKISKLITTDLLVDICRILSSDLERLFGLKSPKIGILGLNPHAGENGILGDEEINTILPAIKIIQNEGINAIGPLAADTAFLFDQSQRVELMLAMYHDQGLPLFKFSNHLQSANVTLGIPIIRTSVDHGVALDKAASGEALNDSLHYAIAVAENMYGHASE